MNFRLKRLDHKEVRTSSKLARLTRILIIVLLGVFSLELWMGNRLATYGSKTEQLKKAQANLELENQILENQIDKESSLTSMEKKAAVLGFSEIKNLQYIKTSNLASARP